MNKRKILESAQKHLQRGALDKALEDYQTLLKADAKDSNIRLKVGDLHLKLGRSQDAIDAYLRVAQQFTNEGFDAKAVALYKQITKLDEKRFEVHAQLGELYQRMGLSSEAMKAMQFAADGAHRAGDKGQALTLLRRMAALDPTNTTSRLKVADLLRAEGKIDDALAEYDEVVRELERQNNGEEKIKVLERALEFAPGRVETLRALTRAAVDAGANAKAERAARALLAAAPDDLAAIELCGSALERVGQSEQAAELFRNLAERFRARGDEDRARELTQRYGSGEAFDAGGSDPPVLDGDAADLEIDPEIDASLGLMESVELEPAAEADTTLAGQAPFDDTFEPTVEEASDPSEELAPEIDPDADFDQLVAEASVFLRYGKHERAIETLRAALRVEPGNPLALEKLGEGLAATGNRAHASSALARAGAAYADAGDSTAFERVRARLAPIDAKAAAALAPPPARSAASDASPERDLEVEIDTGLDDETLEPVASPADDAASSGDFAGIEIDVSGDLAEADGEPASPPKSASEPPAEGDFSFVDSDASPEPTPEAASPTGSAPAGDAASRAAADYEEAEFFREQGLVDEARALYERVLAAAPDHASARQRLDEIASPPASGAELRAQHQPGSNAAPGGDLRRGASVAPSESAAAGSVRLELAATPAEVTQQVVPLAPQPVVHPPAPAASVAAVAEPPPLLGAADFDLAAELSGAFGTGSATRGSASSAESEGFAEVFAAFKAGVKREVSDGDYEAHYDLGIAYKEMGLFEDAIGEFRCALSDAGRKLACLHLMAACALELGRVADAIAHLSEALAAGPLPADQEASLRLDLGRAYQASGDRARAHSELEAARAAAPGFADIDRLIAEIEATPAEAPAGGGEAFESFDDLIGEQAPSAPKPSPEAQYESFDELLADEGQADVAAPSPAASARPGTQADSEIELRDEVTASPASEPPEAEATEVAVPPPASVAPLPPKTPPAPAATARRKKKISFV